ncbi:MAG: ABA4-like family protein [Stackebrandtia sp.]
MAETLFQVVFLLAAPFWALMILLPAWSWTRRIVASPLIAAPAAAVYAVGVLPMFGEAWAAVSRPELAEISAFLSTPEGTAVAWAHFIAFDLFVGRWAYLDARERGVHPLIMAPVLLLTIMLAPLGFLAYLAIRAVPTKRSAKAPQDAAV